MEQEDYSDKVLHIRSLDKYHPGYKDRKLSWAKIYFNMVQGDPDCEMIEDEIDFARLIKFIILELQAKRPIPLNETYLTKKGFDLGKRPISLTISMLQKFIVVNTVGEIFCALEEEEDKEEDKEEERDSTHVTDIPSKKETSQSILQKWNIFAAENELSKILSITDSRKKKINLRLKEPDFNIEKIFEEIKISEFCRGYNDRGWKVSFDFIIESTNNYLKILEGKYRLSPHRSNGKPIQFAGISLPKEIHASEWMNFIGNPKLSKWEREKLQDKYSLNKERKIFELKV